MTPRSSIELDSTQYDTAQNFTLCSMILRGTSEKLIYLGEIRKRHQKRKYFNQLVSGTDQFE